MELTIDTMNAQNLLRLIKHNEEAPGFELSGWIHECGTFGCLVGNDAIACFSRDIDTQLFIIPSAKFSSQRQITWESIEYEFGLSGEFGFFLFGGDDLRHNWRSDIDEFTVRRSQDRAAAIARVRKLLYYFLHKREMLYDERGCVREEARRREGDWNVVRAVAHKASEAALATA